MALNRAIIRMRHLHLSPEFVSGQPARRSLKLTFSNTAPKRDRGYGGQEMKKPRNSLQLFGAKAGLIHLENGRNRHAKVSTFARAYA